MCFLNLLTAISFRINASFYIGFFYPLSQFSQRFLFLLSPLFFVSPTLSIILLRRHLHNIYINVNIIVMCKFLFSDFTIYLHIVKKQVTILKLLKSIIPIVVILHQILIFLPHGL